MRPVVGREETAMSDPSDDIREAVRHRYTAAARALGAGHPAEASSAQASCWGNSPVTTRDHEGRQVFGSALYGRNGEEPPEAAGQASLGCGVPTAVADLHPGETVLDLGSGAGADVLIAARRVAPGGKAIGLDMTSEMLDLARANAAAAGIRNAEFLEGYLEQLPLPDASIDVVISNCVINLAADKNLALGEAARVLRPGGRLAISDVIADPDLDDAARADMQQWTGCIAGALTEDGYRAALAGAGFGHIEIIETHRVHAHAAAAIIRARIGALGRSQTPVKS